MDEIPIQPVHRAVDLPEPPGPLGWKQPRESKEGIRMKCGRVVWQFVWDETARPGFFCKIILLVWDLDGVWDTLGVCQRAQYCFLRIAATFDL